PSSRVEEVTVGAGADGLESEATQTSEQWAPARRRSRPGRLALHLGVLLLFTLATIVVTWPMFPQLGGFVVTRDDPVLTIWEMAWQAHAAVTNPLHLLDGNINYPFRATLTFDEF